MFDVTQVLCLNCHHQGYRKTKSPGSFIGELFTWIIFIIISSFTSFLLLVVPIIYTMYRALNKTKVCEKCDSIEIIPLDSPKAVDLIQQKNNTKQE